MMRVEHCAECDGNGFHIDPQAPLIDTGGYWAHRKHTCVGCDGTGHIVTED